MAILKGEGAFQNVNLIGEIHEDSAVYNVKGDKSSGLKGMFVTFQVDQSYSGMKDNIVRGTDPEKPMRGIDTNPYLASVERRWSDKTGDHSYISHRMYYSASQIEKMKAAAGDKSFETDDGKSTVVGLNASLMRDAHSNVLVNTNKPMEPTTSKKFGPKVLENQAKRTMAAREIRDKAREKTAQAAPVTKAKAKQAAVDEPAVEA